MPPANKTRFVISGKRDVVASKAPHSEVMGVAPRGNPVILECSQGVEHTLLNAWAPSTRRAYAGKWKAFSQWCEEKEIVPHDCTLRDLLDFLQSLLEHGLSCSTIKVYVFIHKMSLKSAFLLAIATARRVSELRALSVSPQCLRWGPECKQATLWPNPAFLPKVLSPLCQQANNIICFYRRPQISPVSSQGSLAVCGSDHRLEGH